MRAREQEWSFGDLEGDNRRVKNEFLKNGQIFAVNSRNLASA